MGLNLLLFLHSACNYRNTSKGSFRSRIKIVKVSFSGVAVWGSRDVGEPRCGRVAVWGSCGVGELRCGGVAVWGSCGVGELRCG